MGMLSEVAPWDMVAEGYSEVTMKMFRGYTDTALAQASLDQDSDILDVACGPGTLTLAAAPIVHSVKAIDFSQAMINILDATIKREGITNIETHCGDGQALPYADNSFDAAFSMFGLMFFPDRMKGYQEILRTLKPGGKTVISSWAPTERSPLQMALFGALKAMKPELPEPQTVVDSLENPEFFKSELAEAGFRDIEILPVTESAQISSVEEFWADMVKGSAPIVMMKNNMPDEEWQEKSRIAIDYLQESLGGMPVSLSADAWFGIGVK